MHPHLVHPHRTTRSRRWFLLVVVTVSALAVAVGAALGSPTKSHATTLTALIGSSGPAETFAVNGAAKAFTKQTGIDVNVIVASDLGQQLAQGFASGNPPDIFYLSNDQCRDVREGGQPRAARQTQERQELLSEPARGVHVQGPPVCGAEGLLDARPRDQQRFVAGCEADGQELPEDVGAARVRREEAHPLGAGRPLHRCRVPPPRRVHDSERRLARLQGREDRHGQQQGEHRRRSTTSSR